MLRLPCHASLCPRYPQDAQLFRKLDTVTMNFGKEGTPLYVVEYWRRVRSLPPPMLRFLWTDGIYGLSVGIIGVLFNLHLSALGYSSSAIAFVTSISPFLTTVLSVAMGRLADRYGRSRMLLLGTTLAALGALLQPLFQSIVLVSLAQVLFSLGAVMIGATEFAIVAAYVKPEERAFTISVIFANFMLMIGVGSVLGGVLPSLLPVMRTPYESTLILSGIIFLIAPLGRITMTPVKQTAAAPRNTGGWFRRPSRAVMLYGLFALLSGLSYGFTMPYLNLLLARQFGLSAPVIGSVLAMNEAALFLGSFLTPLIMDRTGAEKILGPLLMIVCLANAALATSLDLIAFAALLLIRSAVNMVYAPTFDSRALGSVPDADRATMQSFRALMRGIGSIVSVWGGGLFLTWRAYRLTFAATSAVMVLMFVFYHVWLRSVSHDGTKPA